MGDGWNLYENIFQSFFLVSQPLNADQDHFRFYSSQIGWWKGNQIKGNVSNQSAFCQHTKEGMKRFVAATGNRTPVSCLPGSCSNQLSYRCSYTFLCNPSNQCNETDLLQILQEILRMGVGWNLYENIFQSFFQLASH